MNEKLTFSNTDKRNIHFRKDDENSDLVLKSLKDGQVDFHDKRVNVKSSSLQGDLLEVELGQMTSLNSNQLHIDQVQDGLLKGQEIVDDS